MAWQPLNSRNAIDRVRIFVQFKNPMKIEILDKITDSIVVNFQEFGFKQLYRSEIQPNVSFDRNNLTHPELSCDGWVLNSHSPNNVVEEVGFRVGVFGYMTTEYKRWTNLEKKYWDIFQKPLSEAIEICEINSIRLEYWDRFSFEGNSSDADIKEVLPTFDNTIPEYVFENKSLMHSNVGWFEKIEDMLTLIQRNIDLQDISNVDSTQRILNFYTLVEMRQIPDNITIEVLKKLLKIMHEKSVYIFGNVLSDQIRSQINLQLKEVKS